MKAKMQKDVTKRDFQMGETEVGEHSPTFEPKTTK